MHARKLCSLQIVSRVSFNCFLPIGVTVTLQHTGTFSVTIAMGTKLLPITYYREKTFH